MGAGDSKLSFKKDVFRLSEEHNIPANDPYWLSFWELPESAADVFTLFSSADIRRTRDAHLENLETLILVVTSRLFTLRHHPSFPDPEIAPERDVLNCIRILTRLLPFIYEKENLAEWERKFFWGSRRKRTRKASITKTEVIFDEAVETNTTEGEQPPVAPSNPGETDYETVQPLMEELIDTLVDMLFYVRFTLPKSYGAESQTKVPYTIWQSGVGSNTPVPSSKELESNKIETLRLLLSITSQCMFIPANLLPVQGTRALTYLVTMSEKRVVLSLLCSLLNTTLKYNPASWRVPYDHIVFSDPRRVLVTYSLQLLLVLLLYPVPECTGDIKNSYRHWLGRLHRTQDFQFMVDGMSRILSQPMQAHTSYLPGSQKALKWAPEMIMLFWETLQVNKRFRSFIIDTDRAYDFVVLILFYALEHRLDPSKSGVVRMCIFVLQTLSAEQKFGICLNKRFEEQNTLPQSMIIPGFSGTFADYLIISIYNLITTSKGKLSAVYPALLATVANIAPHVKNLSGSASSKLIQLFASMSTPEFLLANESNHTLLSSLLESMNAIIEHQYSENPNFVYAILRSSKRFEALRNFTLESGQEEIDRQTRLKKDRGETSPKTSFESIPETPSRTAPPRTLHVQEEQTPFAIGDDEESDEEVGKKKGEEEDAAAAKIGTPTPTPLVTSPTTTSPPPGARPLSSPVEDAVPYQLRGMSEKARGKMPERSNSTASLASQIPASATGTCTPTGRFTPTPAWIETWLPHLQLHTLLTIINLLEPEVRATLARANVPGADPNTTNAILNLIRSAPVAQQLEASAIRTHLFEWSHLALGWYESLLWGFIFVSEMDVSKGTVGVWNGTTIKLFKVKETKSEGVSLLAPRGAVDALGTTLVERLGSVGRQVSGGGAGAGGDRAGRRSISSDNGGERRSEERGGHVI